MIIVNDVLDAIKTLPEGSVDCVFADPPFNMAKGYTNNPDNLSGADYLAWSEKWLNECLRVLKPTGSLFVHNTVVWSAAFFTMLSKVAVFRNWIVWDAKGHAVTKSLIPAHSPILHFTKTKDSKLYHVRTGHERCRLCGTTTKDYGGKKHLMDDFGYVLSDVWTDIHRVRIGSKRDPHPCQLPVHLVERVILLTTDAGDVVLDPFMGTGTTLIAAKRLSRTGWGIDNSQVYADIAAGKLSKTQETKLDSVHASFYRGRVVSIRDCDLQTLRGKNVG